MKSSMEDYRMTAKPKDKIKYLILFWKVAFGIVLCVIEPANVEENVRKSALEYPRSVCISKKG
jgi:hypothetical protein